MSLASLPEGCVEYGDFTYLAVGFSGRSVTREPSVGVMGQETMRAVSPTNLRLCTKTSHMQ